MSFAEYTRNVPAAPRNLPLRLESPVQSVAAAGGICEKEAG